MPQQPLNLVDTPLVQTHLTIMQGVIQRMAQNSASAKTWCISLVSAILFLAGRSPAVGDVLVALVPVTLFLALDAYYLGLEKGFRARYQEFVVKAHAGTLAPQDFFEVKPSGRADDHYLAALASLSVWPFYLLLFGAIALIKSL